jgi:hypothetical protein
MDKVEGEIRETFWYVGSQMHLSYSWNDLEIIWQAEIFPFLDSFFKVLAPLTRDVVADQRLSHSFCVEAQGMADGVVNIHVSVEIELEK